MSENTLTGKTNIWKLIASILHITSVAIMFFSTVMMVYYSYAPKLEKIIAFSVALGLHFIGCLGNLSLLWTFSTHSWNGSSQQFSLVATVVPGLIDGAMFAVLASIYSIFLR